MELDSVPTEEKKWITYNTLWYNEKYGTDSKLVGEKTSKCKLGPLLAN